MVDWQTEIARAVEVQAATQRLDVKGLWEYHAPRNGAREDQLEAIETHLGCPLDSLYRRFLRAANGWPCFYQRVTLFGTDELRGGAPMATAQEILDQIRDQLDDSVPPGDPLLLVAAAMTDLDVFVMPRSTGGSPAPVIWLAGQVIDRFESFDRWFLAMVEYNGVRYRRMREQAGS
jgi:hypothetical protein